MQIDIHLFDDQWQQFGQHYWRGYAWLNGKLWSPANYKGESLEAIQQQLNGCFTWIINEADTGEVFVVNDQIGSTQLFYGPNFLTDRPSVLNLSIDRIWLDQNHWQYVEALPGRKTIYQSCQALLSNEFAHFKNGSWSVKTISRLAQNLPSDDLAFKRIVSQSCQRLIDYANGKQVVVLLSDGYDSRLILAALVELACPNLLAVTYGIRGNGVVERAEEIANRLGVDFYFLDYANPEHAKCMTSNYPELVSKYSNGQTVIQEQEIFACALLQNRLPKGSILVPGISGDLQGGSYVPPFWFRWIGNRTDGALRNWLLSRLTRYPNYSTEAKCWKTYVDLQKLPTLSEKSAVLATERVVVHERLSKYICSTLRVYEHFGFDWYLPQWDAHFIHFWANQPIENRRFRTKYRLWCEQFFFQPLNIFFADEVAMPKIHLGRIIKRFLPFGNQFVAGIPDPNRIAPMLQSLLGESIPEAEVNAALGNYLTDFYKKELDEH